MRTFIFILTLFILPFVAKAAEGPVSINVLIDNSATLLNVADAQEVQKLLLHQITQLRKKRETRFAVVNIVSLNDPRNLFVGTPKTLLRNARSLLPKLGVVINGCMDLAGAFEQVRTNVENAQAGRVEVYIVSSMIVTGAPCDSMTINLPHPAPKGLDLAFLTERRSKLRGYWVNHLQMRPMLDAFRNAGFSDFRLFDEASSKTVLQESLK